MEALNAMSYHCENCGHIFSQNESLCEDREDIERCLGCPKCNSFLIPTDEYVDFKPTTRFNYLVSGSALVLILLNLVFSKLAWFTFLKALFAYLFISTLLYMLAIFIKGSGMPTKTRAVRKNGK
jgi:DNA-directed RNA polymerase subunit RPC12/RpoP